MTEDERKAMEWLRGVAVQPGTTNHGHVNALLEMLARPTLPEDPNLAAVGDAISALGIAVTMTEADIANDAIRLYHNHLVRRLTAPKTKTTWNVSWKNDRDSGGNNGEDDFNAAMETARRFAESGCVVTITPHKVQA